MRSIYKKSFAFLHNGWSEGEIKNKIPLTVASKRKYLGINLAK